MHHFCAVLFKCILQPTEGNSDVISGSFMGLLVPDNRVKFGDPGLNLAREIPLESGSEFSEFSTVFLAVASDRK